MGRVPPLAAALRRHASSATVDALLACSNAATRESPLSFAAEAKRMLVFSSERSRHSKEETPYLPREGSLRLSGEQGMQGVGVVAHGAVFICRY
jgi:hypothetical protein